MVQVAAILHFFGITMMSFIKLHIIFNWTFHLMNQWLPMVMIGRRTVQCESSQMKSLHLSMLAAHDTGIKKHYHMPTDSVVLEDFMTHAADALTILPECASLSIHRF